MAEIRFHAPAPWPGKEPALDEAGGRMKRLGVVALDEADWRELERPPYPYQCPNRCGHDVDEHDDEWRCHAPGCDCGKNKS